MPPTPDPSLPPGAYVDIDHDDEYIDMPEPTYGPDGHTGKTGAELDKVIDAGNLPSIPPPPDD